MQLSKRDWIIVSIAILVVLAAVSLMVANAVVHTLRSTGKTVTRTGGQVAFLAPSYHANDQGSGDVFVVDVDSGQVTQMTSGEVVSAFEWSPDGESLYLLARGAKKGTKFSDQLNVSTGVLTPLPNQDPLFTQDYDLAVSPDGSQLLYSVPQTLNSISGKVTVSGLDGSAPQALGDGGEGQWSPDGKRIVFTRGSANTGADIYTMAADGSNVQKVVALPDADHLPSWTPDGKRIVFGTFKLTEFGTISDGVLYRVDADGKNLTELGPVSEPYIVKALPNGKAVYSSGPGNTCVTPIDGGKATCKQAAESTLSPDGKRFAMTLEDLFSPAAAATNVRLCLGVVDGGGFTDGACFYQSPVELWGPQWRLGK